MQDILNQMLETARTYLPNLAAATAILVGGWLVARILAAVVRRVLNRTKLDNRLAAWIGGERGEALPIENMFGKAVFYLVMLFVLVAFFQALNLDLITEPLNALLTQLSEFAPRVLGAAGLLILAWVVATALRRIVSGAMSAANLDERLGERTLEEGSSLPLSRTLADAVYWLVFSPLPSGGSGRAGHRGAPRARTGAHRSSSVFPAQSPGRWPDPRHRLARRPSGAAHRHEPARRRRGGLAA